MAKNKHDSFWTSYSDLMTSLFFVMLVLFIICLVKIGGANRELKDKQGQLEHLLDSVQATNEQLRNILQLEEQFKVLSQSTSLEYDSEKKMFFAKDFQNKEIFFPNQPVIDPQYEETVDRVGREILEVLKSLNENKEFKYQMVIEGNAAIKWNKLKSHQYDPDDESMYLLSYNRALTLYRRWMAQGIDFRKYNTEVILAGSGFNGINRDTRIEDYNKRFVLQIIPKINRPTPNTNNNN